MESEIRRSKILIPCLVASMIILMTTFNSSFGAQVPMLQLYVSGSANSRAVLMLVEMLGVKAKIFDVLKDEKNPLAPEFSNLGTMRGPPALKEGDFILEDSHVILQYLVEAYGSAEREYLYPRNPKKKARINEKLFFHSEFLIPAFKEFLKIHLEKIARTIFGTNSLYQMRLLYTPIRLSSDFLITKERVEKIIEAYKYLEMYLSNSKYLAGKRMTIADLAAFATVSNLAVAVDPKVDEYPKLLDWITRMSKEHFHKKHNEGAVDFLFYTFQSLLKYTNDVAELKPTFNRTYVNYQYIADTLKHVIKMRKGAQYKKAKAKHAQEGHMCKGVNVVFGPNVERV